MKFVLIVRTNHLSNSYTALKLAQAALTQHSISCVYFLFNGAYTANKFIDMPTDEFNLSQQWSAFATSNNIDLLVCAASGLRRGICENTLAPGFKMGSIGQLVASCDSADRVVSL
jgi:tRNA 2-thiouridine synthesizing protein D